MVRWLLPLVFDGRVVASNAQPATSQWNTEGVADDDGMLQTKIQGLTESNVISDEDQKEVDFVETLVDNAEEQQEVIRLNQTLTSYRRRRRRRSPSLRRRRRGDQEYEEATDWMMETLGKITATDVCHLVGRPPQTKTGSGCAAKVKDGSCIWAKQNCKRDSWWCECKCCSAPETPKQLPSQSFPVFRCHLPQDAKCGGRGLAHLPYSCDNNAFCTTGSAACTAHHVNRALSVAMVLSNIVAPGASKFVAAAKATGKIARKKLIKAGLRNIQNQMRRDFRDNVKTYVQENIQGADNAFVEELLEAGSLEAAVAASADTWKDLVDPSEILEAVDPTGLVGLAKSLSQPKCGTVYTNVGL